MMENLSVRTKILVLSVIMLVITCIVAGVGIFRVFRCFRWLVEGIGQIINQLYTAYTRSSIFKTKYFLFGVFLKFESFNIIQIKGKR